VLEGAVLGNLFFEASTRTRISFNAAFCRLGGSVCDTTGFTFSSMAKGESLYDTSRVVSGYVDAIVMRHPEQGSVAQFAEATHIPVINGGDGPGEHPSQALLDLYTIDKEFARLGKSLAGAHLLLTGDLKYGRTGHSLIKLLSLYAPLRITLVSPPGLEMPTSLIDLVHSRGHRVEQRDSLISDFGDLDVVYATRIQKERFTDEMSESFAGVSGEFTVDRAFLDRHCSPTTVVMHPLPRDSRPGANDLSVDLNGDPRLAIFRQTDNGIPLRMAIFATLLEVDELIERDQRDVRWFVPKTIGVDDASLQGR
ncbi:MAG TPA: aspartate carbamoyltransferase, partial [Modicisalibacter sp.]|nr:aspartate carbamoyltransferase [Modicisalibacter sp.]